VAQVDNAAAPAQDGPASGQYFLRIAFMSKSATPHQNFRLGFETVKNARADYPAGLTIVRPPWASHDRHRHQAHSSRSRLISRTGMPVFAT
jgi:hypothetical protein